MRGLIVALPLASIIVAVTPVAGAHPVYWKCHGVDSGITYVFLIDLANQTFDGVAGQVTLDASSPGTFQMNAQGTGPDREPMLYTLSLPSGVLTGDGRAGASVVAQCEIPDEAVPDFAVIDPRVKLASTEQAAPSTPTAVPAAAGAEAVAPDTRYAQFAQTNEEIQDRVRRGKLKQQQAARLTHEKFISLFPEQAGNALLNEYFAYAEVVGEKVDHKKLTVAEGQYELARKASEIQERQARLHADLAASQAAAAHKVADEAAVKHAAEESSKAKAANASMAQQAKEVAEKRLAVEQQVSEQQHQIQQQQRLEYLESQRRLADKERQENLQAALRLLVPPRPRVTTCTGGWVGQSWMSNCTSP